MKNKNINAINRYTVFQSTLSLIPTQNCDYLWSIVEKQVAQLWQRDRATHGGLKPLFSRFHPVANNKREKEEKVNQLN